MTTKKYDLVVTTGSYTNRDGIEKRQYKTIGAVWQNDKGFFMTLDKSFNPAGINSDRDTIMVSMFDPRPKEAPARNTPAAQTFLDDQIPF